jgi:hypothetical protein
MPKYKSFEESMNQYLKEKRTVELRTVEQGNSGTSNSGTLNFEGVRISE